MYRLDARCTRCTRSLLLESRRTLYVSSRVSGCCSSSQYFPLLAFSVGHVSCQMCPAILVLMGVVVTTHKRFSKQDISPQPSKRRRSRHADRSRSNQPTPISATVWPLLPLEALVRRGPHSTPGPLSLRRFDDTFFILPALQTNEVFV